MTERAEDKDRHQIENARIGYQVATNLSIYEGEIFWSKFNALLVANSIILGAIALSMTNTPLVVFTLLTPIVGIILCGVWLSTTKRSFDYYKYWIFSAREIEERYLRDSVQTLSRGGKFAEGKDVEMTIGGERKQLQMSCWSRLLRVERASYLTISLFFLMYVVLFVTNIISLLK